MRRRIGAIGVLMAAVLLTAPRTAPAQSPVVQTLTAVGSVHGTDTVALGILDANSRAVDIRHIASLDPGISSVLADRPDLELVPIYRSEVHNWSVHLREPGATEDLARVVVDDRTHAVSNRYLLSRASWPPRQRSEHVRAVVLMDPAVQRRVAGLGGIRHLVVSVVAPTGDHPWQVDFSRHNDVLLQVEVQDSSGDVSGIFHDHQVAWSMARGIPGAFGGSFDRWYLFWPPFVLFALVVIDWRRPCSWASADVVAVLAFGVSWACFNHGRIAWSVPLAVPPLVWLTGRMAWLFARGVPSHSRPAVNRADDGVAVGAAADARKRRRSGWRRVTSRVVPTWAIVLLAVLACGTRWGLDAWGGNVIDVGYAGVAGAHSIASDRTPYGNMPSDNENGDTYGPLNYVAYLPAIAVWHDTDWGNGLPAAKAVSIGSDVLCLLALVLVGWRWLSRRAAALLALSWATCPWTLLALCSNSNDLLVAALVLLAFAALRHPVVRGIAIGAAVAVKFVPIVVCGAFAHCGLGRRWRQTWQTAIGVTIMIAASVVFVAGWKGGWHAFVHATFGFQYGRVSPFSPWGMYGLRHLQQAAQAVLLVLVAWSAWRPRARDFRQVAAGAAAALGGLELTLQHWFYLYLPWMLGLVLVVLVAQRVDEAAPLR